MTDTVQAKDLPPAEPPPEPARGQAMDPARLRFIPERPEDREVLVAWLATDTWPFHGTARPTAEQVRGWLAEPTGAEETTRAFWVIVDDASRVGRIVLQDLGDLTALASFRVRTPYRGRGIGVQMVRWAADHVFGEYPRVQRLAGETRVDNLAMRRVFRRAGWVAEAFYRRAWPSADGTLHDAVGYAILRTDWEHGTVTPVPWPIE